MPKATRRTVLLLLVAALLALPGAISAAGPQSPRTARALQAGTLDLWSQLWKFLGKGGCGIDPDGLCAPKEGCGIDPNGLCAGKAGCNVDPNGARCISSAAQQPQAKEGCHIDPNGRCFTKIGCEVDPDGRCLP